MSIDSDENVRSTLVGHLEDTDRHERRFGSQLEPEPMRPTLMASPVPRNWGSKNVDDTVQNARVRCHGKQNMDDVCGPSRPDPVGPYLPAEVLGYIETKSNQTDRRYSGGSNSRTRFSTQPSLLAFPRLPAYNRVLSNPYMITDPKALPSGHLPFMMTSNTNEYAEHDLAAIPSSDTLIASDSADADSEGVPISKAQSMDETIDPALLNARPLHDRVGHPLVRR